MTYIIIYLIGVVVAGYMWYKEFIVDIFTIIPHADRKKLLKLCITLGIIMSIFSWITVISFLSTLIKK